MHIFWHTYLINMRSLHFLAVLCLVWGSLARKEIIVDDLYKFEFELFNDNKNIRFWLTGNFTGWVGIGVGPNKNMIGADLFLGGYNPEAEEGSRVYGGDYFGTRNGGPTFDDSQDWVIEAAAEVGRQTTVQVSRPLVTGDTVQDVDITNTTMNVLWGLGPADSPSYHGGGRGFVEVNLVLEGAPPPEATTPETSTTDATTTDFTTESRSSSFIPELVLLLGSLGVVLNL